MPLSDSNEFQLIEDWADILQPVPNPKVLLGIGDDAACLADLVSPVFSCDALVENVHFRTEWISPRQLGWKSMAVNVSDMAAMGAAPVAVTVSLSLPPQTDMEWVQELYRGFSNAAKRYNFTVVGGDTTRSSEIIISVAIIGELISSRALRRDAAKEGDALLVTGTLGDSAAGLKILQAYGNSRTQYELQCVQKHLQPQPRLHEIQAALQAVDQVHAAIDISDGIAGDAAHIAKKSQLNLDIDVERIPISGSCKQTAIDFNVDPLEWALAGGEDYELLLCVDSPSVDEVMALIQNATNTPVSHIGFCRKPDAETPKVHFQDNGKSIALPQSWRHF